MRPNQPLQTKCFAFYLFFLCCFLFSIAHAQVKPLYFYNEKQVTDKNRANSYAITGKLSGQDVWVFKRFDLNDGLIETGSYKDEELTIPHGLFTYYMDVAYFNNLRGTSYNPERDRFMATETNYVDGKINGKRISYYPDGIVMEVETFKNDVLDGPFLSYDRKGRLYSQGLYVNGKKEGEWKVKYGKRIYVYEDDKLVSKK